MYSSVIIILTFVSVCYSSDVLVFTEKNFDTEILKHEIILVEFYAPWCGHCKKLAPEYEIAATRLKSNDPPVPIAKVDCIEEKSICEKHGVSGYPTLKVFKNGEFAFEYEGGRDADGITRYMSSKAGPSSKTLQSPADLDRILKSAVLENIVVGFFSKANTPLEKAFITTANQLSSDFKFAHTLDAELVKQHGEGVTIFTAKHFQNKFEKAEKKFPGSADAYELKTWIEKEMQGLAGLITSSNTKYFSKRPLITAHFPVDYQKNPKGTNYWRNRFLKVINEAGHSHLHFAYANSAETAGELAQFGFEHPDLQKVYVVARDADDKKYRMTTDFSVEAFRVWLDSFAAGKETAFLKSAPESDSDSAGPVKVVVASNFDRIVNDASKDVLIEFYAPWCGHCKSLEPKYTELADRLKDEPNLIIAKMDATANDVPAPYKVSGFPTIYFAGRNSKNNPVTYNGEREVEAFIKYLAGASTGGLKTHDNSGQPKKVEL